VELVRPKGQLLHRRGQLVGGGIDGPCRQRERPLYEADGGHGMLFTAPDGTLYLAIHTPNATPDERPIFVEIAETDDGLIATENVIR
jgi:hypothetical protein